MSSSEYVRAIKSVQEFVALSNSCNFSSVSERKIDSFKDFNLYDHLLKAYNIYVFFGILALIVIIDLLGKLIAHKCKVRKAKKESGQLAIEKQQKRDKVIAKERKRIEKKLAKKEAKLNKKVTKLEKKLAKKEAKTTVSAEVEEPTLSKKEKKKKEKKQKQAEEQVVYKL